MIRVDKEQVAHDLAVIILKSRLDSMIQDKIASSGNEPGLYDMADYVLNDYKDLIGRISENL